MADQGLYDKATTTSRGSGVVRIMKADAGNPSGYEDYQITPQNLIAAEITRIATNESDISTLQSDVSTLQDIMTKTSYGSKSAPFTDTMSDGDIITMFFIKCISTTVDVKIGTTLGGEQILPSQTVTSGNGLAVNMAQYFNASTTIYISVLNGTAELTLWKSINN